MTVESAIFICSICGERASEICVYCTKDACVNHRCHRCKRCSDCCECEVPLSAAEVEAEPQQAPEAEAAPAAPSISLGEPTEPPVPEPIPVEEPPGPQPDHEILP